MISRSGNDVGLPDETDATSPRDWKTIVEPEIRMCDRLMAFVDLPNANVGFEVGYGLGLGKPVALVASSRASRPG